MAKKQSKNSRRDPGFPERLRQLRTAKKLSQEELGKLVGLHYTHIGRYERGLSSPSADKLQSIAATLDVSSDYLLNGSSDQFAKAKFEDQDLLEMFRRVQNLPADKKTILKDLLDAYVFREKVKQEVAS